jgi:hypothetical protein
MTSATRGLDGTASIFCSASIFNVTLTIYVR